MAASTGGIYGLSGSGMDVDDMVKKIMQAQQARYDKMYKNKVKTEWQKTAYNDYYKSMTTFKFGTLGDYKLERNLSPKGASVSDSAVIGAKAGASAVEMQHTVTVTDMASNAYLQSKAPVTRMDEHGAVVSSSSIFLKDIMGARMYEKPPAPPVMEEPDPDTATAADWATYNAWKQDYENNKWPQYVSDMAQYESDLDKTAFSFQLADGSKDDSGNDVKKVVTFTYRELVEGTLNDLADKINRSGLNLQASYDGPNDSFNISQRKGGENNKISIGVYTGGINDANGNEIPGLSDADAIQRTRNVFNNLHLAEYQSASDDLGSELQMTGGTDIFTVQGASAKVKIDGREYSSDSNKITVAGIEYTLMGAGTAKATVTSDTEAIVTNVKKFIEEYNKMIDSMNDALYQKAYPDYLPLTDDEKSAMSKEEIEKWEEKAKSGILYRDDILRDIVSEMRSALSRPINGIGKYDSAANIGITTTDWTEHGHLQLDDEGEATLRAALAEDPECVYKVFVGDMDSDESSEKGLANRLTDVMTKALEKVKERAGVDATSDDQSSLGLKITSIQDKMKAYLKQMNAYQDRLYKQFNAMETAIASLNSQSNFVTNFTSGG